MKKLDLNKIIGKLEDAKTSVEEVRSDKPDERLKGVESMLAKVIDELEGISDAEKP